MEERGLALAGSVVLFVVIGTVILAVLGILIDRTARRGNGSQS